MGPGREDASDEVEEERRRFASIASHDLSEPLRTIHGFASLLQRKYEGELDETADVYLRHILDGTRRMQRLIDGLLAYGRIGREGTAYEPVDLGALLRGVVEALDARVEEVQATVLVDELPTVSGDRAQLEQLFQNLLLNALRFHGEAPPHVEVSAARGDGEWVVSVADRGIGVPEERREEIFGMFIRGGSGDDRGAGIGLAVCERVVANHGGRIWVEDNPGGGSVFRVAVPDRPE
ncbi:MAG TPA: ATP-binding protein [Solirubrobacteraceae bacterium]|nr:ATP-binding protein [Solirubrobacteraceae bacterium]